MRHLRAVHAFGLDWIMYGLPSGVNGPTPEYAKSVLIGWPWFPHFVPEARVGLNKDFDELCVVRVSRYVELDEFEETHEVG